MSETQTTATAEKKTPTKAKSKKTNGAGAKATKVSVKGARGAAKAQALVDKAKGEKKSKRTSKPVAKDSYDFRVGTHQSSAAGMYGRKNGATMEEVKSADWNKKKSAHLNLFPLVRARGFPTDVKKEANSNGRQVNRYYIKNKTAKKAA